MKRREQLLAMDAKPRRWFAVIVCLVAACSPPQPHPSPSPAPSGAASTPSPAPSNSAAQRFEAPGITFDYPLEWEDQTEIVGPSLFGGRRAVATLAHGMTLCPGDVEPEAPATGPAACTVDPTGPGELRFDVSERGGFFPGYFASGIAFRPDDFVMDEHGAAIWTIESPNGGYYTLRLRIPSGNPASDRLRSQMRDLLASVAVEPWERPSSPPGGLIRETTSQGFSFEYPAGWARYYPAAWDRDRPIVAVASQPVLTRKLFEGDSCQVFVTPPNTAVVVFSVARGANLLTPDFTDAQAMLAGQPAFRDVHENPTFPTCADELERWTVRRPTDLAPLRIEVYLSGPDIDTARAGAQRLLDSIEMEAGAPSPS